MKMMNRVILVGRLTKKIELRYTTSNKAVAQFSLAVNREFKNKNGEYETDFINCELWGKQAETISKYTQKGDLIAIAGSLRIEKYKDSEGNTKSRTYVIVEHTTLLNSHKQKEEKINNGLPEDNLDMPF